MNWPSCFWKSSENAITQEERRLFALVASTVAPNVIWTSLRLQMQEWVSVGEVGSLPGLPNWFKRKERRPGYRLLQQRPVAAYVSLPKAYGDVQVRFEARTGTGQTSQIIFTIDEIVKSVEITDRAVLLEKELSIVSDDLANDVSYWVKQGNDHAEFRDLAQMLIALLDGKETKRVVLPAPGTVENEAISGVALPPRYRDLLSFANGMRVGLLMIWGNETPGIRVETLAGRPWLYVGSDDTGMYALPVKDGVASDEVYRLARAKLSPAARDIVELMRRA